jgi:two-component system cell cycle response regulator DivK
MTEAWDGEAGVNAAKEQRPDLVLIDIQLPHMGGYEATRRIKADPELKSMPVIAVASFALSATAAKRMRPVAMLVAHLAHSFMRRHVRSWRKLT